MASGVTLLFQPFNAIVDQLVLDASVKEEHVCEVEVTDHPVEQGSAISDHARSKPEEITIEGVVSNTPLNHLQTRRAVTSEGYTWDTTASNNAVRGVPGNAEAAEIALRDLRGKLVTIVTALRTYDNMTLVSLKIPRDQTTGDILRFEAKFRQIRIVTNATTVVATKVAKAKPQVKKGSQPTTTPTNAIGGPNYTALRNQVSQQSTCPLRMTRIARWSTRSTA
jgi:hypothetical protein